MHYVALFFEQSYVKRTLDKVKIVDLKNCLFLDPLGFFASPSISTLKFRNFLNSCNKIFPLATGCTACMH